jgi:hypothetical protein
MKIDKEDGEIIILGNPKSTQVSGYVWKIIIR